MFPASKLIFLEEWCNTLELCTRVVCLTVVEIEAPIKFPPSFKLLHYLSWTTVWHVNFDFCSKSWLTRVFEPCSKYLGVCITRHGQHEVLILADIITLFWVICDTLSTACQKYYSNLLFINSVPSDLLRYCKQEVAGHAFEWLFIKFMVTTK